MDDQVKNAEASVKKAWPVVMAWVAGASAIIGLIASLAAGVTWFINHHQQNSEAQAKLALAQTQARQGDYQASIQTYSEILKADPSDNRAVEEQLDITMLWVENYQGPESGGQSASDQAAVEIGNMIVVLEAGLSRTKGPRAADVEAHLGWAHWLNEKIAQRESGQAAEQNLRAALATDPANVYANAMLGNWMLQNGGDFPAATHLLDVAVSTGKQRHFVRKMQVGGLLYNAHAGARAELVKIANAMRNSGEDLDEGSKSRILGFCFGPIASDHKELVESLSAVDPDDAWKTFLWLDDSHKDGDDAKAQLLTRGFIQANLLEISGNKQEALAKYRSLLADSAGHGYALESSLRAAIARLSHS
jgi:tetratricopeptide (TPR) repeat protein